MLLNELIKLTEKAKKTEKELLDDQVMDFINGVLASAMREVANKGDHKLMIKTSEVQADNARVIHKLRAMGFRVIQGVGVISINWDQEHQK